LPSQLSVPAYLVDPDGDAMDFLDGIVRVVSSDGLLLDFADSHGHARVIRRTRYGWLHEFDASTLRFVSSKRSDVPPPCPNMYVMKTGTPFGLFTQSSEGSHGLPDRYIVTQLSRDGCGKRGSRRVVCQFLSETGN
jgi:hypothetical protein